jgi:hypothetical protein
MAQSNLFSRRRWLQMTAGGLGVSLPGFLGMKQQAAAAETKPARAKRCIVLFCWGGISHIDTWDPKPDASADIRGEFHPIDTAAPGIRFGEHMPLLAKQADKLAVIRSIHHDCSAHGKGMYWNMTGHRPPQPGTGGNLPPSRDDWPSLAAMISNFHEAPHGMPSAVRLPYPLVDNGTLQAGEFAGFMGVTRDPIVIRPPSGKEYGGVSRNLGSAVLKLNDPLDEVRMRARRGLLASIEQDIGAPKTTAPFEHFRELAGDMLLTDEVKRAYNLEKEDPRVRESYGEHICGHSVLLARRLSEAGVPIVTVCCAAGDLNSGKGDHWDTHGDNFNRLKKNMLPPFDRAASALLADLHQRGLLDETLVVFLTDFGRTPKINGGRGRDHYPSVYSVALAGGGIRGGQVYGTSDAMGAFPKTQACTPADLHATIFHALGIPPKSIIYDALRRPLPISDGKVLPLV